MKKKQKIRVEKTEKGVEVFIDPEVTKISKGDIPSDAELVNPGDVLIKDGILLEKAEELKNID